MLDPARYHLPPGIDFTNLPPLLLDSFPSCPMGRPIATPRLQFSSGECTGDDRLLRRRRRRKKREKREKNVLSTFTIWGSVRKSRGSSRDGGFRAESVSGRVGHAEGEGGRKGEKGNGCRNACPPVVGPFARIPCGPSMSPLFLNLAVRIQIRSFRIGRGREEEEEEGVEWFWLPPYYDRPKEGDGRRGKRDARGVTLCARRRTERKTTTGIKYSQPRPERGLNCDQTRSRIPAAGGPTNRT